MIRLPKDIGEVSNKYTKCIFIAHFVVDYASGGKADEDFSVESGAVRY